MTARGWGSSRQTLRKAENSTAAASPTVPRNSARSTDGSRPVPPVHDVGNHLPRPGAAKRFLARLGIEPVQHVGAHLDVEQDLGRDSVRCPPGQPVLGIDPDLQMDEARRERRRHAMHHPAVGLPVAAGDQRGALGQFVFADLAVEDELIERRLHHLHRGRQFFEVDEPAAGIVRGRQEGRRRPAGPVGAVAPRDAAEIDGVEQERPDVDILAAGIGGDLLGNGALGGAGRSPYQSWLTGLDQKCEGGGKFAGAQRVVGGDGVGVGHRRAPEWLDGGAGTLRAPGLRPAGSRNSRSVRRAGLLLETPAMPGASPRGMSARPSLRTGLRMHDRGREKWTSGIGNSRKPGSRWPAPPRRGMGNVMAAVMDGLIEKGVFSIEEVRDMLDRLEVAGHTRRRRDRGGPAAGSGSGGDHGDRRPPPRYPDFEGKARLTGVVTGAGGPRCPVPPRRLATEGCR